MRTSKAVLLTIGVATVIVLAIASRGRPWEDTEETLYPHPAERTEYRMRSLAVRIGRYWSKNHKLPVRLSELPADSSNLRYDAWDRSIEYKFSDSTFELRSRGPDGIILTADDIVMNLSGREATAL